jgi:hypothetical protein
MGVGKTFQIGSTRPSMIVDEGDGDRASSSQNNALAQDLVGLPKLAVLPSSAFSFSAMSVRTPARCPLSISAFLT